MSYRYVAIPTEVNGVVYASKLEARLARLLIAHRIPFTPHARFELFDRNGQPFVHYVDFLLDAPVNFMGTPLVDALEVKGRLTRHDFVRCDGLYYFRYLSCWLVLEPLIALWEKEGMFP